MSDGSSAIIDIRDYFEYIIIKHETITNEGSPIKIYANKIKNRIVFKIKTGYKLELLTKETMQLLGSSKKNNQDKNGKLVPQIENVDVVLIHCNVVNNTHHQKSRVLHSFVPNKKFGQLVNVEPQSLIMLKTTSAAFSFIKTWFTNQNN